MFGVVLHIPIGLPATNRRSNQVVGEMVHAIGRGWSHVGQNESA